MTVGRLAVSLPCRENGEDGEAAAYFGLVAFGELAESLARHLKGDMVGAFGRRQDQPLHEPGRRSAGGNTNHDRWTGIGPHHPARRRAQGSSRRRLPAPRTRCCSPNPTGPNNPNNPNPARRDRLPMTIYCSDVRDPLPGVKEWADTLDLTRRGLEFIGPLPAVRRR